MKFQWQVSAHETNFSHVNVVFFQLHESVGLEAPTEGTLIVDELDHCQWCILSAQRIPTIAETHIDLLGRLGSSSSLSPGVLFLQRLPDLPQFIQYGICLIFGHALGN